MLILFLLISFLGCNNESFTCKKDMENLIYESPFIFEAEIVEVGEAPELWSDNFVFTYQKVKYKTHRTFKGTGVFDELIVSHPIYKESPFVEKDKPQLASTQFYKGRKMILFVKQINPGGKYRGINENEFKVTDPGCHIWQSDKELIANIEKILKK